MSHNMGSAHIIEWESQHMGKIKEIMQTGNDNPVANKNCCFRDVLEIMDSKNLGAVNIVDGETLIGIITDGDVRRLLLKTQDTLPDVFMKNVTTIMMKNPKAIQPNASFQECLEKIEKYCFWVLPVTDDNNRLLGIVHLHTLLKAMVEE